MNAYQTALFGPSKYNLYRKMRLLGFQGAGDSFQNNADPGFAIAAQDGGAVGAEQVALELGVYTPSGLHRIHVGRQ